MKTLLFRILLLFAAVASGSVVVEAQTLMEYVKQQQKEAAEKEKDMYEQVCKKGTLEAFQEYAKKYPKGKYIDEINKRIADYGLWANAASENTIEAYNAYLQKSKFLTFESQANDSIRALEREKDMYEQVCKKGTLEACQEYAKKYPKGKYIDEINKRIADYGLWANAASKNTIEAYNAYLQKSKFLTFKSQANDSIKALESVEEWNRIKNSDNLRDVEIFISAYPSSSCIPYAQKRIHELTGVSLYNSGSLLAALNEFNEAGGKYALQRNNQVLYDDCKEYCDYMLIAGNPKVAELESFLARYPNGKYSDDASNKIAILKAKDFTMFSSEYNLNSVLSYAKDEDTRSKVRRYYDTKMDEYAQYQKEQRRERRRENGGIVTFGIEFLDMAFNPESTDDYDGDIDYKMYYNIGLSIKLGNYRSPVQFEVGVKFGLTSYSYWDYYDYYQSKTSYHIPFYARLKIGLGGGDSYKWFIDGIGYCNKIKDSFLESEYSWSAGFGASWRHIDWRLVYYKQDIDPVETYSDFKFIGTSLIYYF